MRAAKGTPKEKLENDSNRFVGKMSMEISTGIHGEISEEPLERGPQMNWLKNLTTMVSKRQYHRHS